MVKLKKKVLAQRKFAQGAYVPPTSSTTLERRLDTTPSIHQEQRNIIHNNMTASNLMDVVSLQKLHTHFQLVVVLERLQPEPPKPLKSIVKNNEEVPTLSQLQNLNCSSKKVKFVAQKQKNTRQRETTYSMRLRSRSRPVKNKRILCTVNKRKAKKHVGVRKQCNTDTGFSVDDNRPLKFFTKKRRTQNTDKSVAKLSVPAKSQLSDNSKRAPGLADFAIPGPSTRRSRKRSAEETPVSSLTKITSPKISTEMHTEYSKHEAADRFQPQSGGGCYREEDIERWLEEASVTPSPTPCDVENAFKVPETPSRSLEYKVSDELHESIDITESDNLSPIHSTEIKSPTSPPSLVQSPPPTPPPTLFQRPPSPCPSERYTTVEEVISAPQCELDRRCKDCRPCGRVAKVHVLTRLIQEPEQPCAANENDVYEFKQESDDVVDHATLPTFRQTRSQEPVPNNPPKANESDNLNNSNIHEKTSEDLYLDLLPGQSTHVVQITETTLQGRKVLHASLVEKSDVHPTGSLIEHVDLQETEGLQALLEKIFQKLGVSFNMFFTNNKEPQTDPKGPLIDSNIDQIARKADDSLPSYKDQSPCKKQSALTSNLDRITQEPAPPTINGIDTDPSKTGLIEKKNNEGNDNNIFAENMGNALVVDSHVSFLSEEDFQLPATTQATNTSQGVLTGNDHDRSPKVIIQGSIQPTITTTPSIRSKTGLIRRRSSDGNYSNNFPKSMDSALLVDAPVYSPTEKEFQDPISYFEKIMPVSAKFGMCKIILPQSFKPPCHTTDKMPIRVCNQYIARMYSRWGPAAREMTAIKAYLSSQGVPFIRAPLMDGVEVNLPKLYHLVQRHGGLKKVIEKKRWGRIAEEMHLTGKSPEKTIDKIYVKHLLPYDTLSHQERQEIICKVEKHWNKLHQGMLERAANPLHRQKRLLEESESSADDSDEEIKVSDAFCEAEECVLKGRNVSLTLMKRVGQIQMQAYFPNTLHPKPDEVEKEYWRIVLLGTEHVCINSASVDTGDEGYGFPKNIEDPYGDHPWNLKRLRENSGNILGSLGSVLGVTVPTLHLGMVFSTSCWHRDPHGLPWIEYMHSGSPKIWYGIPDDQSENFRKAVETLCPTACQNKSIWLPSDIAMIPPNLLREHNVSLSRVEQKAGEFIIVFPKAYSSSICTGYTVSESVYFGTYLWLYSVNQVHQELRESCEPTMFSIEKLLVAIARDSRATIAVLQQVYSSLAPLLRDELENRRALHARGVRFFTAETFARNRKNKKVPAGAWNLREQDECEICRTTLYLSKVTGLTGRSSSVCVQHALRLLESSRNRNRPVASLQGITYMTVREIERCLTLLEKRVTE